MKSLILNLQIIMLSNKYLLFDIPDVTDELFLANCFKTVCFWIKWGAAAGFAFKICQALFQYFACNNNPQLKAQYKSDFKEPIVGLILIFVGYYIIIGIASLTMPEIIEAHAYTFITLGG